MPADADDAETSIITEAFQHFACRYYQFSGRLKVPYSTSEFFLGRALLSLRLVPAWLR